MGTGSARACIINAKGDIVGLASENIELWQPETGYYVCLAIQSRNVSQAKVYAGTIHYRYLAKDLQLSPQNTRSAKHRSYHDPRSGL